MGQVCTYSNGSDFCGSRSLSGSKFSSPTTSASGIYSTNTSEANYLVKQNSTFGSIIALIIKSPTAYNDVGTYTFNLTGILSDYSPQFKRTLTVTVL